MIRKKNYIKICAMGLALCMLPSLLSGCNQPQEAGQEAGTETTTLWVLTEISKTDGMNYQAEQIAKQFEEEHEGVTVQLEILPTDEEEREVYLKQLRTQIMAGEGPDVYLLPTGDIVMTDVPGRGSQQRLEFEYEIEPLFSDVMQAMYNGIFADVSRYYDADVELNTEGLNAEVMEAGVIDGCRYVLPLRYDMPTLFVDLSSSEDEGISQTLIDEGIGALAGHIIERNDTMMSIGLQMPTDTSLLPTLFDYEKGEILITEQEIADYLRLYQKWYALSAVTSDYLEQCEEAYLARLMEVVPGVTMDQLREMVSVEFVHESLLSHLNCIDGIHWSNMGFVLYSGSLQNALEQEAITWVLEKNLESYPLRALDGSVVAEVTYYGAVGAGTKNTELAYEFLREFLTEDYQWDILRPQTDRSKDTEFDRAREVQNDGLVEESWPVRSKGAAYYLWKNLRYQLCYDDGSFQESLRLYRRFNNGELMASMEDMNVLNYEIDEVRFPITQEYEESLEYALTLLNNADGTTTDVDIDALAKEIYIDLWWHLAEG